MKKYTDKEVDALMDSVGFPKGLSYSQLIKVAYWSMFNRKRLNIFCNSIERGKSIYFSFKDAQKTTI